MKHFGLKARKISSALAAALLVTLAAAQPSRSMAQTVKEQGLGEATIHGHVSNPIGQAVTKGEVRFTTDVVNVPQADMKFQYKFPLDANGDFKGTVAPGKYLGFVFEDAKTLDFTTDPVLVTSGGDKVVNFDMSRAEYLAKMSPEDRKALEEYKKKNAEVVAGNAKIQNLNAMLTQARADNKAGNYDAAITAMQQATTTKPDEGILWITLGDAQLGS